ncbi:MAG: hypothetical protein AAGA75_26900 [Cyanobacteria bacterium P01_E01_bin.6]
MHNWQYWLGSIGTSRSRRRQNLDIDDVSVSLTDEAASVLNQAFGVNAFEGGFKLERQKLTRSFLQMATFLIAD